MVILNLSQDHAGAAGDIERELFLLIGDVAQRGVNTLMTSVLGSIAIENDLVFSLAGDGDKIVWEGFAGVEVKNENEVELFLLDNKIEKNSNNIKKLEIREQELIQKYEQITEHTKIVSDYWLTKYELP